MPGHSIPRHDCAALHWPEKSKRLNSLTRENDFNPAPVRRRWQRLRALLLATLLLWVTQATAVMTDGADAVFSDVRSALLQIRTVVGPGEQQSSIGSGFLVSADGLAITNYHVVAQHALEPGTYRLQYREPDGSRGDLELLAIDVLSDLAVVRRARPADVYLEFDALALTGATSQGERLFAIGNPMDIGFTIVEGTHNGMVERSFLERIHFSGALNAGMSGGPALTRDRRIAGVNVARMGGGQLISFLVPPSKALALLDQARNGQPMSLDVVKDEIASQVLRWQAGLFEELDDAPRRPLAMGRYRISEPELPWLSCWAGTNRHSRPQPRVYVDTTRCSNQSQLFIDSQLNTGAYSLVHSHVINQDLNSVQFARHLSSLYAPETHSHFMTSRRLTAARCHDEFVSPASPDAGPELRVLWCARAYREFDGIFDIDVSVVTRDSSSEALVSRLEMKGVSWETGTRQVRRLIEDLQWTM